jgi:uncharacterized membrane protein
MALTRRHALWAIVGISAIGLAVRLFFAFHWFGSGDLFTFEAVGRRTIDMPLHTYGGQVLYPYPPGYLPWLVAGVKLSDWINEPFSSVGQLLPIVADLALAAAIYVYLGWRGAGERIRVAGFALVMLGPVFVAISGYHGQMDAVAVLPGVLALMVWERRPASRRAIESGLLIGIGALIKTVPILLVLPLLASARSLREKVRLAAAAGGVFVLGSLPFYLAEPDGYKRVLSYTGVPGRGGISVLTDPGFAADRRMNALLSVIGHPNGFTNWISQNNGPLTVIVLLALAAFLFRYRPAAIDGIVILWLAIYVFSPNFLLQYTVWALPFFIMAGYLREVAVLQILLIPALILTYTDQHDTTRALADFYVASMICLWLFWVVALVTVVRRVIRRPAPAPGTTQPPLVERYFVASTTL